MAQPQMQSQSKDSDPSSPMVLARTLSPSPVPVGFGALQASKMARELAREITAPEDTTIRLRQQYTKLVQICRGSL